MRLETLILLVLVCCVVLLEAKNIEEAEKNVDDVLDLVPRKPHRNRGGMKGNSGNCVWNKGKSGNRGGKKGKSGKHNRCEPWEKNKCRKKGCLAKCDDQENFSKKCKIRKCDRFCDNGSGAGQY